MSPSEQHLRAELDGLEDLALVIEDPRMAEQLLRVVGVVTKVWALHQVNANDKCLRCREPGKRVLRKRQQCAVREIYDGLGVRVPEKA
jgi:hypothetical protein